VTLKSVPTYSSESFRLASSSSVNYPCRYLLSKLNSNWSLCVVCSLFLWPVQIHPRHDPIPIITNILASVEANSMYPMCLSQVYGCIHSPYVHRARFCMWRKVHLMCLLLLGLIAIRTTRKVHRRILRCSMPGQMKAYACICHTFSKKPGHDYYKSKHEMSATTIYSRNRNVRAQ